MNTPALVTRVDPPQLPSYSGQLSALTEAPADARGGPNRLLLTLQRYWWLLLLIWLALGVPATYLIYRNIPAKYVAQGSVKISPIRLEVVTGNEKATAFYTEYVRTQAEYLKSPKILREAASSPRLANYPFFSALPDQIHYLAQNVNVVPSNELILVTVVHEKPEFAKDAVNAVMEAYGSQIIKDEDETSRKTTAVLEGLSKTTSNLIAQYQSQLNDLMRDGTQLTSDEERNIFVQAASKSKIALEELERNRSSLRANRAAIAARADPDEATFKASIPVENDSQVERWKNELTRIEIVDQILQSKGATAKHPDRTEYAKQRKMHKANIEQRGQQIRENAWRQHLAAARLTKAEQLERADADLKALDEQIASLSKQVAENSATATTMKSRASQIAQLKEQLTEAKETNKRYNDRIREVQSQNLAPGRIADGWEAITPRTATVDARPKLAVAANGGALLVGFVVLIVLMRLRDTIEGSDDLPENYRPLVVGTVSHAGSSPKSLQGRIRRKILGEEMRLVHANLLPPGPQQRRVMMITSPTPANGKTSIASHLALSLAKSGLEVLLIDADLRKRDLSSMFDLGFRPGLVELLRGKTPELVRPVELLPNLRIMGAGAKLERNPVELFQRRHFRESLDTLQEKFDCIIIDTPPTLVVADARLIAGSCDDVLCVVRAQMTSQKDIDQTVDALTRITGKTPKLIVNGVEHRQSYYKYKFSYTREDNPGELADAGKGNSGEWAD